MVAGGCALFAVIAISPASGRSDVREPPSVTCSVHERAQELAILARDRRERIPAPHHLDLSRLPPQIRHDIRRELRKVHVTEAEVRIERRIDEITVIDETPSFSGIGFYGDESEGSVRRCGPPPTVGAIDSIDVALGKHSDSADLSLDLRYGALAPGASDEGDGGSEIELDAHLGSGYAELTMTRGADSVTVDRRATARHPAPTVVNLNAAESSPDGDLTVGRISPVLVDGRGGDDRLSSSGGPAISEELFEETGTVLVGGQGADALVGGAGADGLFDGPGRDEFEAGAGSDAIIALGRVPDRIDCGPGLDFAIVSGGLRQVHRCEKVATPEDLRLGGLRGSDLKGVGLGRALRRTLPPGPAQATALRLFRLARSR
jgi:hypothetical protein